MDLAAGYRRGTFTPVDVLDACLARVEQCEPALNAMVWLDAVQARAAAEASGMRWRRGAPLGPLDGVPVSVKDNLHVAGMPTRWGSRLLRRYAPGHDELPVARLRTAGAVLFGKTNVPEFAMQGYTSNAFFGTTRNPWNPTCTPGGSSGGAAAAVAAGYGPLALATDGGGSIRRPASHCGAVGFKPSPGLVPRAGGLPRMFLDFEVAGGIGRSVEDVRRLVGVLAATDLVASTPGPARILFVPRFGRHPIDFGIAARVREAATRFEESGHHVEEALHFDLAERINVLWPTLSAAGLAWMLDAPSRWPEFGLEPGGTLDVAACGDAAAASLRAGREAGAASLFDLLAEVEVVKRALEDVFARHDFILTPATAALPWPAQRTHPETIAGAAVGARGHAVFAALANAAGVPAIALPYGFVHELPTGFQLIGRSGADAALLALAAQFERAHPWGERWPDVPSVPVERHRARPRCNADPSRREATGVPGR